MKKKIKFNIAFGAFAILIAQTVQGQGINSATMYDEGGNNPGSGGSYYGANCDVLGSRSLGGGYNSDVSGSYSVGLGYQTNVTGNHSFAFGNGSSVTSHYSVGIGSNADASGMYSLSLGSQTLASSSNSVAFGSYVQSTQTGAMTIGLGYSGSIPLVNNVANSLMIGYGSDLPTFHVGPSSGLGTVGNVGIGTTSMSLARLTISQLTNSDWYYGLSVRVNNDETKAIAVNDDGSGTDLFIVWGNGMVNAKKLYTEEVEVRVDAMGIYWPDYVFEKDFRLTPLNEVENYIKAYSHLPDVPSENELKNNGLKLGEMEAILLKKIEELTLYIIEQNKELYELKQRVNNIQN